MMCPDCWSGKAECHAGFFAPNPLFCHLPSLPQTGSFFGLQSYDKVSVLRRGTLAIYQRHLHQSLEAPLQLVHTKMFKCVQEHWAVELNGRLNLMNLMK